MAERVLLLLPTTSYKARQFLDAAGRLGVEVTVGTDRKQALDEAAPGEVLALDFARPHRSVERIVDFSRDRPLSAVLGVDDETTVLAAMSALALGLLGNPVESVRLARDKYEMRVTLLAAGLRSPGFKKLPLDSVVTHEAQRVRYPCVLKPLFLSASRGVLRADAPDQFADAFARIVAILKRRDVASREGDAGHLLVEDYLPGEEMALEGLIERGEMRTLALFDKPDPLEGPTFEETLYVTPSRQPREIQQAVVAEAAAGCRALGLVEGPVHAEFRLAHGRPTLLEIAPRSIGGLCSRTLRFGTGLSLEDLVLRHALRREVASERLRQGASGVMMIPIPKAGLLRGVHGLDDARCVRGIEELTISLHVGAELVPLPEGNRYLGFIFARANRPEEVESALREAHGRLRFEIQSD
jgi:biotin carboxylase